jgi:hypothetical protein
MRTVAVSQAALSAIAVLKAAFKLHAVAIDFGSTEFAGKFREPIQGYGLFLMNP